VSRLVLVISDLYPARQSMQGLPRLAGLEQWLARGRHARLDAGWQQWLLDEFLAGYHAQLSWAEVAAAATGPAAGQAAGHAWLATPVHLVAGIDTVRLHPGGLLHLDRVEQQALVSDFATVFHDAGWRLQATSHRELLLWSDAVLHARSTDPARWLGTDPAAGLVAGQDARPLRRLGAELEMWLHEHPVNRARSDRGLLPVSGLWIWGGPELPAPAPRPPAPRVPLRVHGADLFLEGLCQLTGASSLALERPWPVARSATSAAGDGDAIVHHPLGAAPDSHSLQALERELITPLLQQLRRGDWDSLTLLAGLQAVTLRRAGWRAWRALVRSRPWWESLLG
jgi:hypothetical protein